MPFLLHEHDVHVAAAVAVVAERKALRVVGPVLIKMHRNSADNDAPRCDLKLSAANWAAGCDRRARS